MSKEYVCQRRLGVFMLWRRSLEGATQIYQVMTTDTTNSGVWCFWDSVRGYVVAGGGCYIAACDLSFGWCRGWSKYTIFSCVVVQIRVSFPKFLSVTIVIFDPIIYRPEESPGCYFQ
jgi:hypothetical protein